MNFDEKEQASIVFMRSHYVVVGVEELYQDKLTPLAGLEKVDAELKKVYASAGHPENWKLLRYDGGHLENPEMREEIRKWFVEKL